VTISVRALTAWGDDSQVHRSADTHVWGASAAHREATWPASARASTPAAPDVSPPASGPCAFVHFGQAERLVLAQHEVHVIDGAPRPAMRPPDFPKRDTAERNAVNASPHDRQRNNRVHPPHALAAARDRSAWSNSENGSGNLLARFPDSGRRRICRPDDGAGVAGPGEQPRSYGWRRQRTKLWPAATPSTTQPACIITTR
jgi:hypothetical protein